MAIQDTFIGNLRAAGDIARGMARVSAPLKNTAPVDKSSPIYNSNIDKPTNPAPAVRPRENNAQLDQKSYNAAESGTMFALRDRLDGVPSDQYQDFINNRPKFSEMMSLWVEEDDPHKRINIVRDYATKNRFIDNKIFADLLDTLGQYDDGNINDKNAPADAFTREMRKQWQDAFEEDMDAAQYVYNPERHRLWS